MRFENLLAKYLITIEDKDAPPPSTLTCYEGQRPSNEKIKTWCKRRNGKGPCPFLVTRKKADKLRKYFEENPDAKYVQEIIEE